MKAKELEMILKKKEFIDAKTADYIKKIIFDAFGPEAETMSKKYNINLTDIIRFRIVEEKIKSARENKGITLKQIAHEMKVTKYKLEYIEKGRIKHIEVDLLNQYIDRLKIRRWFEKWKKHNRDVYKRIGKNS